MSEIRTGFRSILLKHGWIYRFVQFVLGGSQSKRLLIKKYIPQKRGRILEIGCGAGHFAYFVPKNFEYIGFDPSSQYIESAKHIFAGCRSKLFLHGKADNSNINSRLDDASMDFVVVHGVFHHVTDNDIENMFALTKRVLKPGAKLIILEPVWYQGQSKINRTIMSYDRGTNIKEENDWVALFTVMSESWGDLEYWKTSKLIYFYDVIIASITKRSELDSS